MDRKLVAKGEAVFASSYYYAELNCANMLRNLNIPMVEAENLPSQDAAIRKRLERMAENLSMELDELQLKAVEESIKNGLFILSGGPGTGKTTTINMIIRFFESEGMDIFLAAPTGRAAKRMTEATGSVGTEQCPVGRRHQKGKFRAEPGEPLRGGCGDH